MRCKFVKPDQTRCNAVCVRGKTFCAFHDPDKAERFAAGRTKGGIESSKPAGRDPTGTLPADTPDLPLRSVADVMGALAENYNAVRTGRLAVGVGNCLALIAQSLLKAIEGHELERRLEALEGRQHQGTQRRAV